MIHMGKCQFKENPFRSVPRHSFHFCPVAVLHGHCSGTPDLQVFRVSSGPRPGAAGQLGDPRCGQWLVGFRVPSMGLFSKDFCWRRILTNKIKRRQTSTRSQTISMATKTSAGESFWFVADVRRCSMYVGQPRRNSKAHVVRQGHGSHYRQPLKTFGGKNLQDHANSNQSSSGRHANSNHSSSVEPSHTCRWAEWIGRLDFTRLYCGAWLAACSQQL